MSAARRPVTIVLMLLAFVMAAVDVSAVPANASTDAYEDSVNEAGVYDQRGDITFVGTDYEEGFITVVLGVGATEPLGSSAWTSNGPNRFTVDIDLDGGDFSMPEFQIDYQPAEAWFYGSNVFVRRAFGTKLCEASTMVYSDAYAIGFDASCIGSPEAFQVKATLRFDNGMTMSNDQVPDPYGYCCAVIDGPLPDPEPEPDPGFEGAGARSGYWMITEVGEVHRFGDSQFFGSEVASTVKRTDIEPTPSGNGYWILAESGAVHAKGDAVWHGSALDMLLPGETAAALSATPSGNGYWIFTSKGRVFARGGAVHFGDMSGTVLNGPVLDSVATPTGAGYYMVASDGGIFTFGDADFHDSMGGKPLNKPVMSMAPDPDGVGYWLVASDGGIFAFAAGFHGSMGGTTLNKPVSGIVPGSDGYLMVAEDGGIFSFGAVKFHGSLGANPPASPVVAVALMP